MVPFAFFPLPRFNAVAGSPVSSRAERCLPLNSLGRSAAALSPAHRDHFNSGYNEPL